MNRSHALLLVLLLGGCHGHAHEQGERDQGHGHPEEPERPSLSFTHWSEQTELFVELPALVRGMDSPFAAHVTRLSDFAPLEQGSVTVVLRSNGLEERFPVEQPSVAGIFRPVAKPRQVGSVALAVDIKAPGIDVRHELGTLQVYESVAAAQKALPEEPEVPGRITFLKEQAWPIRLASAQVKEAPLSRSVRVFGRLVPRADASTTLTAPSAGRVLTVGALPHPGQALQAGEVLLALTPRLEAADRATLDLSLRNAEAELQFAGREQARLEAMRAEGVVSEKRSAEALRAVNEARARVDASQRRLAQFRAAQSGGGRAAGSIEIRAPFAGVVAESWVRPGAFAETGAPLVRVVDPTRLWLEAHLAEQDAELASAARGAWVEVEGASTRLELGAQDLVALAPEIDEVAHARTIFFAVDNTALRFTPGSLADVHLAIGEPQTMLAVPEAALIDDNGLWVVFVEVEGESFERRIVEVLVRDRGLVGVRGNLRAGEWVATQGAYAVKLAASTGAVPAHGHTH